MSGGALVSVFYLSGGGTGKLGRAAGPWPDDEDASEVRKAIAH